MAKVLLGDVVDHIKDKVDKDTTDLEFYVGGEHIDGDEITVRRRGRIEGSTIGPAFHMRFRQGDVLLMSRNPHLRKASMVDFDGICSDVSYVCRTKDNNVLLQSLLPFILQTPEFWQFAEENKKGGLPFFLNWKDFARFEFELLPIERQQQISDLLWAMERVKNAYRELIARTDDLVKSQFVEMFGIPETGDTEWPEYKLQKLLDMGWITYVEGSHPAIIEKGLFDLAQQEMQRRRDANDNKVGGGRYSSRYPFSGMLVCGICGSKLRRQVRTMGSGKRTASWGCCNRINNGRAECDSHHVNEDVLEATYLTAMRRLVDSAEEVVEVVRDGTELALEPENKAAMDRIDEETIQLQEAALALHKAKQRMEIGAVEYASRVKEYSERMKELEAERNELQGTAAKYAEVRMWLDTFIEQTMQSDTLTTVDGTTMKMLVDRIHVRNDGIVVEFKCGVAIEQEYVK